MKVRIERLGGFAGVKAVGERESHELDSLQKQDLSQLLKAKAMPSDPGADRFRYRVSVLNTEGERQEIDVPESSMPASLRDIPKIAL